ncbi:glutathione S-transferase N-terminal domain-containing protein [Pseudomonas aeruginosa]
MSLTPTEPPLSPFVRKQPPALAEKGLDYQLGSDRLSASRPGISGDQSAGPHPGVARRRPGPADSSVICQYLEERHPEPPNSRATPPPAAQRCAGWKIRRLRSLPATLDDLPQPDTRAGDGPGLRGES